MPEHLPDSEHGLCLHDVLRPQPAGDLEGRLAPVLDRAGDHVEPVRVERHALGDQRAVVLDRRPVARIAGAELHHLRLAEVAQVLEERPAPLVPGELGRHHLRARGDVREEVVADERFAGVVVHEQRVRRGVPGAEDDA